MLFLQPLGQRAVCAFYSIAERLVVTVCLPTQRTSEYYAQVISKKKLLTTEDVIDVQREVEILHAVEGHPNIVPIIVCYEDRESVCLVQVFQRTNSAT